MGRFRGDPRARGIRSRSRPQPGWPPRGTVGRGWRDEGKIAERGKASPDRSPSVRSRERKGSHRLGTALEAARDEKANTRMEDRPRAGDRDFPSERLAEPIRLPLEQPA